MARNNRPLALFTAAGLAFTGLTAGAILAPEPPGPTELHESARNRYARIDSYIARLTRRETVKGQPRPQETVLLKVREKPWSVYAKWLGDEGRGREGLYVEGGSDGKVHVRLAAGDIPFVPAGRRMALDPNGALLRAASPHPITDLGIGAAIDKIGAVLTAQKRGDQQSGSLSAIGPERRQEFNRAVRGIEHKVPPGGDPALPFGGRRTYWLDPATSLPTLIVTEDSEGHQVEYYHYDRLELSVRLDDEDFDPDHLWGPAKP